jgi:YesN/AraC family two-component response regulator
MNKRNERLLNILPILNELQLSKDSVVLHAEGFSMEIQIHDNDRVNVVYNYLKDHFRENTSLKEISKLACITILILQIPKKIIDKTYTQFINDYRLVHASKLLAENP